MNELRVLIVEDEESLCEMLRQNLMALGQYVITTVNAGADAMALLEKEKFDVMVTDIRMPGMNGIELLEATENLRQDTEAIVLTGHAEFDNAVDALRSGVNNFLEKPVRSEELHFVIQRAGEKLFLKRGLRESQERYRGLFEGTKIGVAIYQAVNGGTDFLFLDINRAGELISKITRKDVIGRSILDVVPGVREFGLFDVIERVYRTGESEHMPISQYRDNQISKWYENFVYKLPSGEVVAVYSDETEKKQAEERRQEGFDLLSNLACLVPGVIYQYRLYPDGRSAFPFSSPGMYDIYEVTPEEVREDASVIFGRIHPEDHDRVAEAIFESARTLNTFHCELRVILPKQGLRWRWSQAHPERTEDGGTLWHGIILDTTELKRMEEAKRESLQRLELALQGGRLGMWDWNPQDGAVVYNDLWAQMLEYRPDEVEPTDEFFKQHVHPEDLAAVLDQLTGHVEGRLPKYESVYRLRTKSGRYLWVMDRGKIVERDKDGNPVRVIGIIADITERKRYEDELRMAMKRDLAKREKFRRIIDAISQGLLIVNREYRIEFQNRMITERFGENIGGVCHKVMGFGNMCRQCMIDKMFETNETIRFETIAGNGNAYEINVFPFNDTDGENKIVCLMEDISDKKELQAETMRAGHLAAIGELAAGVAHEINNPISGIISLAEIMLDQCEEKCGEADIPKRIIREGDRIAAIVKNLLSFAREKKEEHSPANLADIITDALGLIERDLNKDGIKIRIAISEDLPKIRVRSQEIQQVFLNLFSNSKYALNQKYPGSHPDKCIHIDAGTITVEDREMVRISFADFGTGIPAQVKDKICHPFFSTKPKGVGTGLGLSISHGIIEEHGGRLWFESMAGVYTKALIDIPADNIQITNQTTNK